MRFLPFATILTILISTGIGQIEWNKNIAEFYLGSYEVTIRGNISDTEGVSFWGESRDGHYVDSHKTWLKIDGVQYILQLDEDAKPLPPEKEFSESYSNGGICVDGYSGRMFIDNDPYYPYWIAVIPLSMNAELKIWSSDWGDNYHSPEMMEEIKIAPRA